MTTKERMLEQFDSLDEVQLEALRRVAGMFSDPEDYAEFEPHARQRSLFGGRKLDLEPDEEIEPIRSVQIR